MFRDPTQPTFSPQLSTTIGRNLSLNHFDSVAVWRGQRSTALVPERVE